MDLDIAGAKVATGRLGVATPRRFAGSARAIPPMAALFLLVTQLSIHASVASPPRRLNHERFDVAAEVMTGSGAARRLGVDRCIGRIQAMPASKRASTAALMDVSVEQAPTTLCQRVIDAMASGRMTYDDYLDAVNRHVTVKLVRILQAR